MLVVSKVFVVASNELVVPAGLVAISKVPVVFAGIVVLEVFSVSDGPVDVSYSSVGPAVLW